MQPRAATGEYMSEGKPVERCYDAFLGAAFYYALWRVN